MLGVKRGRRSPISCFVLCSPTTSSRHSAQATSAFNEISITSWLHMYTHNFEGYTYLTAS